MLRLWWCEKGAASKPVAGQQSSLSPAKTWQLTWTMRENGAEASRSSSPTKDLTYSNNVENETTGTDGPQNSWIIDTGNICPMGSARIVSWGPTVLQNIVLYSLYTHESIRASSWACQTYIYIYIYYIYIYINIYIIYILYHIMQVWMITCHAVHVETHG